MKQILLLVVGLLLYSLSFAQQTVWDQGVMEALIKNHRVQNASFTRMKNKEGEIATIQKAISTKMVQIEEFQSKFYNSLKSIEAIVKSGKDVVYCTDIVKDIGKYQKQMISLSEDDPKLLIVAAKAELALINRTADLTSYIYQVALNGTDANLMDNKQRLDMLKHVIKELREMRTIAYIICRQIKVAKRQGILRILAPELFKYKDTREKLVEQLLDDYNL